MEEMKKFSPVDIKALKPKTHIYDIREKDVSPRWDKRKARPRHPATD